MLAPIRKEVCNRSETFHYKLKKKFCITHKFKDTGRVDYKLLFIENVKRENILECQHLSDVSVSTTETTVEIF
jgi:hypothetical protein